METTNLQAFSIMEERFGHDTLISLATMEGDRPAVRMVNGYYEERSFYVITHALSNKMRQIRNNREVAICGEWFTAHGSGENIGHPCDGKNRTLAARLRDVFASWYHNGHIDEGDPDTCILRICLTEGLLFHHGARYDIDFTVAGTDRV